MDFLNKSWIFPESIAEARAVQNVIAQKIVLNDLPVKSIVHIAGMDISNTPFDPKQMVFGATVVMSYPSLEIVETSTKEEKQTFPYIPGLLGFREVPTLIQAYHQLSILPNVVMVDGHGVSHPKGLGVASHVGVILDIPTIGVAKSILVGTPEKPLPEEVGSMVPLLYKDEIVAMMLRTKKRCAPLIISAGHKITLNVACQLVMSCLTKYRLPEPTRQAHLAANICRKSFS